MFLFPIAAWAQAPIVVGEYGATTGAMAVFGVSTHQGVALAVAQANAAGGVSGRPVRLVAVDDGGTAAGAAAAVEQLIAVEGAVVVIGEVTSSLSLAGGAVAQRLGVPMVSPSSTAPEVLAVGDRVFRVCAGDAAQAEAAAAHAIDGLGARTAAVLVGDGAWSERLDLAFRSAFGARGGRVVGRGTYQSGDVDFRDALKAIRKRHPEVLYLPGYYTDVGLVAVQARALRIDATLIGADGWESAELFQIAGSAIEGGRYTTHFAPDEARPEVAAFVAAYREAYDTAPDALAALGYDATLLVVDALRRAPSTDGEDVAAALANTRDLPGVTGALTIGPDRAAVKPVGVVKLVDGQPVWVASVPPR